MLILLAVDGSELSLDAVRHALRLRAEGLNASFVLANVQEPTHLYELMLAPDVTAREGASHDAGMHAMQGAIALLTAAGASFECEVASGEPPHVLIDIAERFGCDAIVMGTRGKGSIRTALVGSVTQSVLHDSSVPVTIVKHPEPIASDDVDEEADARAGE